MVKIVAQEWLSKSLKILKKEAGEKYAKTYRMMKATKNKRLAKAITEKYKRPSFTITTIATIKRESRNLLSNFILVKPSIHRRMCVSLRWQGWKPRRLESIGTLLSPSLATLRYHLAFA